MPGRRLLLFAVLLLVIATFASSIAPRDVRQAVKPPAPGPSAVPADVVEAKLPQRRRVRARVGDIVQLEVRHDARDVVEIVALGLAEPVDPELPAQLVFDADSEGRFPVTLREAGTRVGTVEVRPAA